MSLYKKIFGFDDYHMYDFKAMNLIEDDKTFEMDNSKDIITTENSNEIKLNDMLDETQYFLYTYDYGDNWEIIIQVEEKIDYQYKTAEIRDYCGKYNPEDDIGGLFVFDEIMGCLDEPEYLEDILDNYGLDLNFLKRVDFEKKYKKGSKLRIK